MTKNLIKIFLFSAAVFIILFAIGNVAYALDSNCNGVDDDGDGQCDEDFIANTVCDGADTDSCKEGLYQCPKTCGVAGVYCDDFTTSTTENCYDCNIDSDCDGSSDNGDSDCASVEYCSEVPFPESTSASCVKDASDLYGSRCESGNVITLSKPSRTCTCGLVCLERKTTVCPYGCEGTWPNAYCGSPVPPNTPPSSRLIATGSSLQGDALASDGTVTYNVKQGETITFEGLAWDCDGISDIEDLYPQNNLGITPIHPNPLNDPLGSCGKSIDYFVFEKTNITFPNIGTFDKYIKIKDKSSPEKTSTIQVNVQAANAPPYIPQKTSPSTGAGSQESSLTLKWSERSPKDPDGDADFNHYEIWYVEPGQDPVMQANWKKYTACGDLGDLPAGATSCSLNGLILGDKTYYWNVIAVDNKSTRSHDPWCGDSADCQN